MTAERNDKHTPADEGSSGATGRSAAREAKGSVHEAIGKLIGDDAALKRGTAEKQAGDRPSDDTEPGAAK